MQSRYIKQNVKRDRKTAGAGLWAPLIYLGNIRLNGSGLISSGLKFSCKITLNYSPGRFQAPDSSLVQH